MAEPANLTDPFTAFEALPGPVQTFLLSNDTADHFRALLETHNVNKEEMPRLLELVRQSDVGLVKLENLPMMFLQNLKWSEDKAQKFAKDLAGYCYLPLASFLKTNVWQLIEKWGGDPTSYPAVKVEIRELTPKQLTEEVLSEAALTLTPQLSERVAHLILSRIKDVRDDLELANILSRPEKLGGLGLAADSATRLTEMLKYKLSISQVVETPSPQPSPSRGEGVKGEGRVRVPPIPPKEKPTVEESLPAAKKFLPPSPQPSTFLPSPSTGEGQGEGGGGEDTEEKEIASIKSELDKKLPAEESSFDKRLAESVDSLIRGAKIRFSDPTQETRFKNITTARLRDLRDAAETAALLQLPTAQGGLGLSEIDAKRVAGLIEAEFVALQSQLGQKSKREALAYEEARKDSAIFKVSEQKNKEQAELEKRFLEIAKKSKVLKEQGVMLPPTAQTLPPSPLPSPLKGEGMPVKFPSPLAGEGKGEGKKIIPVLSPGSVAPQTTGKPRVEDVKFTRALTGPIEELRTMTIVAFRRLSKDPKEATLKIKDKINLIQQEGHEKFVAAIRAWKESEPSRLYLELSRAALETGRPVPELIASRESQKQPTLSLTEFQAILGINSGLRF